jgi:hypothetical protein
MKLKISLFLMLMLATPALPAMANTITYGHPGTVAPTNVFAATATGNITGYFYGFSAADDDRIQMCDVTLNHCSAFTFDNQTTAVGTSFNFGAVNAGDILIFNLDNLTNGYTLSSLPADSIDGVNHAYATTYTGGVSGIPAGIFLGMEDLAVPNSDLDYNDDEFVFTGASIVPTPEPASLALISIGILGVFGLKRRRLC